MFTLGLAAVSLMKTAEPKFTNIQAAGIQIIKFLTHRLNLSRVELDWSTSSEWLVFFSRGKPITQREFPGFVVQIDVVQIVKTIFYGFPFSGTYHSLLCRWMLKRQDTDSNWFHLPDPCRPGIFSPKLQSVWETVQIWIEVCKSQRTNILMVILDWFFNEFMIPHPFCLAKYHEWSFDKRDPTQQLSIWLPLPSWEQMWGHGTVMDYRLRILFLVSDKAQAGNDSST